METRETLDEIGLRHGTDKASKGHGYLAFYERVLGGLRDEPISLLEVGVYKGASIKMWADYFPNAKLYGADIKPDIEALSTDRYKIVRADQNNILHLTELGTSYGPFDVVIDDGSHKWDHQMVTLRTMLPYVKKGGYFILEDLQTSSAEQADAYKGLATVSPVDYLLELTRHLVLTKSPGVAIREPDPFLRAYMMDLEFIAWHRSTAILHRRP